MENNIRENCFIISKYTTRKYRRDAKIELMKRLVIESLKRVGGKTTLRNMYKSEELEASLHLIIPALCSLIRENRVAVDLEQEGFPLDCEIWLPETGPLTLTEAEKQCIRYLRHFDRIFEIREACDD